MHYKTHLIGGLVASASYFYVAPAMPSPLQSVYLLSGALLGALLPDIDHPKSYLGRRIPILPTLLYQSVGHRSLTHSLLFTTIVGGGITLFLNTHFGIGLSLGILSHIFLDLLTPQGVSYLYPFKKRRIKLYGKRRK